MTRSTKQWVGKTDDTAPPPRVRMRVFDAHGGKCYLTGRKIHAGDSWDLDHVQALCNGGKNQESNLAPVLRDAHREKTAEDVAQKAKNDRVRKKHLGIHESKHRLPGGRNSRFKKKITGEFVERETD